MIKRGFEAAALVHPGYFAFIFAQSAVTFVAVYNFVLYYRF